MRHRITENDIIKAIKSTITEAFYGGGFRRKFGNGYNSTPKQPGGQRNGKLVISRCLFDEQNNQIIVHLGHVFADGAKDLANAIKANVPNDVMDAQASDGANGGPRVILKVSAANKDKIQNIILNLKQAIESVHDYTDQSIETVCDTIWDSIDAVATQEDIDNANETVANNWRDMLQRLNDPDVRQALLMYQTTNNYARLYGNTLSMGNIKQILEQMPTAAFVTKASAWYSLFNRKIKPGARRIVVTQPITSRDASWQELNNAAKMLGYGNYNLAKQKYGTSPQIMGLIKFKAKENIPKQFVRVVMYDVSDTIPPKDPSMDVWTNEIGLSNNIRGILNPKAEEEDKRLSGDRQKTADELKEKESAMNSKAMEARRSIIQRRCDRLNIDTTPFSNLDDASFVVRASYEYVVNQAPTLNVIRADNQRNDVAKLAALTAAVVGRSSGISVDIVSQAIPMIGRQCFDTLSKYGVTKEEAMNVKLFTDKLIPQLAKAVRIDKVDPILKSVSESKRRGLKFNINEELNNGNIPLLDFINGLAASYVADYPDAKEQEDTQVYEAIRRKIGRIVSEEVRHILKQTK